MRFLPEISASASHEASTIAVSSPGLSLPVISASPSHDALAITVSTPELFSSAISVSPTHDYSNGIMFATFLYQQSQPHLHMMHVV